MMAAYHVYLPTMYVQTAPATARCDFIRPLSSLPWMDCLGLCAYAICLAAHSYIWQSISAAKTTSLHTQMKSAANRDFLGYALVFFNMKQYYLWFVQAIQLNDTYPDPVLQLIAYTEVLHCFKSALLMYRVFDALYACVPDRNSKGVVTRRRVTFAILLLSSGGGLMAYVAAEVHVAAVSFVIPLALIAGLEVLVDLYLLVCVNAELQGTAEPLKESLLADVTVERGEQADEGGGDAGKDGENAGDGGSHNEDEACYSCTTVLKRWRKTFCGLAFVPAAELQFLSNSKPGTKKSCIRFFGQPPLIESI